jgi:hypothetical protein
LASTNQTVGCQQAISLQLVAHVKHLKAARAADGG